MPIYVLRHEERNIQNPLFESQLTRHGQQRALTLVDTLQNKHFDFIYSSPFLRTVQTVYPYCEQTNKKLCIEHALYESMDSPLFNEWNSSYTWCHLPPKYHRVIQKNYKSVCRHVPLYESFEQVCQRVQPFVSCLLQHDAHKKNVLCVTHLTVANAIRNCLSEKNVHDTPILEMGEMVKVI